TQKRRSGLARMVRWWFLLTAGAIACFFLSVISVISDFKDLFYAFLFLGIFIIILQGLFMIFALFTRQWGHAFGIFCGIIASLGIGFLCMIVTAVGQHHPPKINDEDMIVEDSLLEVVEDSLEITDSEAP
ncbi:MAG: hypothetical protein IJ891_09315, partial [Prevotella sp.]|nr:hypothetical protein [Prevotella sp.]